MKGGAVPVIGSIRVPFKAPMMLPSKSTKPRTAMVWFFSGLVSRKNRNSPAA
jgi:hypothetical protein